tara:strand:- start:1013 stop:1327 length:315 start_codon:yes stop_codon:yes gene_type:complete
MARPKKYDIDTEQVEYLASIGCTNIEIADMYGCSSDLLEKSYSEFITKGKASLKKRLRKAQLDAALSGNSTMLIWLGKQMLGQVDKTEIDANVRPIEDIDFNGI